MSVVLVFVGGLDEGIDAAHPALQKGKLRQGVEMEPGWWCGSSLGLDLFLHLFHALFCSDGRTCID